MTRGLRGTKRVEMAEDPLYALQNGIQIDFEWYLSNQLFKPFMRMLGPIYGESTIVDIFKSAVNTASWSHANSGDGHGIRKFFKTRSLCRSCGTIEVPHGEITCKQCEPEEQQIINDLVDKLHRLHTIKRAAWDICKGCQEDKTSRVACNASACFNFFQRVQVRKDYEDAKNELTALNIEW
jgi:DNA polymerase delta subunit 1